MSPLPASPRRARGFTLIETLITAFVLGTAFVAATWSMNATAKTKAAYDNAANPSGFLAQEIFNLADGLPRVPSGPSGVSNGFAVVALNSLVGASFTPPILSDKTVAPGFEGWKQKVALSIYAVGALTTPTGMDPKLGIPPESAYVYRLDVTVQKDGADVDSYSWWLNP
jgi:prepilin-type N-terminal cleavage/methylation domain-containing protein